jgi:hypothetical protein
MHMTNLTELPINLPAPCDFRDHYQEIRTLGAAVMGRRITLIARDSFIVAVHYPVFPSDSDPEWVIERLVDLPLKS